MIPVFEPEILQSDIALVNDALQKGEISGNFGHYLETFETDFASFIGVKHGIAVTSGTTALHLALAVLELSPGDEVLISSSTNVATALAVVHNNLVPIPVDSEKVTWNLDLDLLESLITPKTKAIIPVHLFGHPVDMDALMVIANKHNLYVIEDCAESHGATVRGRMSGSFGNFGCFSFYANKIITTGEGGMVVTDDGEMARKLRNYRNLGFGEPRFLHNIAGYNFRMTSYQAALGLGQVKRIDSIIEKKREIARHYIKSFESIPGVKLQIELPWAKNVYWMNAVLLSEDLDIDRDEVTSLLRKLGIDTRTFFCPMNLQPFLQKDFEMPDCPVANSLWKRGFYLPSSTKITNSEIEFIANSLRKILDR